MIALIKMAYRDLGRNRRRSIFSMLALGIGLALLLLMASVIAGEMRASMETSIRLQSGHLQVRAGTYDEDKKSLAWKDLVANPDEVATKIAALPPVAVATPRLFISGIVSYGEETTGVQVIGVDPTSTANAPYQNEYLQGQFLSADDREGVLIGHRLAEMIQAGVGSQINLMVNTANGEMDEQQFTVRGIYSTRTPSYDESVVLMPIAKAQSITRTENHASTIFVLLKDRDQADAVKAAIQSGSYQVKTYVDMNDMLFQFEQLSNGYMVVLYLIVLAITATVIVNTLVMAVFERTREIGILSAIGMKGWRIMTMFFAESSMLAAGGILIGLALGGFVIFFTTRYGIPIPIEKMGITGMLMNDTIYSYLTLKDAINLSVMAFIVTLLAGLYPAVLAARLEPVDALHGGK